MKPEINIIAALSENYVIGNHNKIPWNIPEDRKHFKDLTLGHPVIMGRKTWDSLDKYKPLPGRANIVLSRNLQGLEGAGLATSLEEAINLAKKVEREQVFIIGGGQIYKEAMPLTDRLHLTLVEGIFKGDAFFPDYSEFKKIVSEEDRESNGYGYKFLTLER